MRIAIIGDGNVGSALGEGLQRAGHEIRFGSTDPKQPVREAAAWGELVILAVPWGAMANAVQEAGEGLNGKTVVDVSNPIAPGMELAVGMTTSAAEEVQKMAPRAKVVKAFNTVFAQHMRTGHIDGERLTALIAGDDAESKRVVMQLAEGIGFEPMDAGPLKSARYLEPLGKGPGFGVRMVG
jgi:hypothetical protein